MRLTVRDHAIRLSSLSSLSQLSPFLGTHEPRTRSRLRSGTQNTGGAAEYAEQEIDAMDQEDGGSDGLPHEDQTEEEEENAMDVGDVVVTVSNGSCLSYRTPTGG